MGKSFIHDRELNAGSCENFSLVGCGSSGWWFCVIIGLMDEEGKVLGVDFGERRIGLAVAVGDLAEPFSIIEVGNLDAAVVQIAKICQQEEIKKIVVGLPLDSQGQLGPAAKKIKNFGQNLGQKTGLEIIFWDECLTSEEALAKMIEAGRRQKKRRKLDDVAAALILQEYLESR